MASDTPLAAETSSSPGSVLIHSLTVIDGCGSILLQAALCIVDGLLLDVGPSAELMGRYPHLRAINGSGYTAIPGLINAHSHAAMGFFRDLGHGQDQMIENFLIPAERSLTPDLMEPLSYSYLIGGLKAGVTCFGDHYYLISGVAKALERLGLRGVIGETIADLGGAFPGEAGWLAWRNTVDNWPHSSRIRPAVAPHAADTVSAGLLKEQAEFAQSRGLPLHMHLSQTHGERQRVLKRTGLSPVAYAEQQGALGPLTLAVHLVAIDDDDAKILARHGVTAGFCPSSQIIYETLAPVRTLYTNRVPLALGTDCAACNDSADLLQEMKLAALLLQDRGLPADAYAPTAILHMATGAGAKAFGLQHNIGAIQPGKAADIVFLSSAIESQPQQQAVTNLIYSQSSRHVQHVMIEGRFVLLNGQLVSACENDLQAEYLAAVKEIRRRLS